MTQPSLLITRPHASAMRFQADLAQDVRQTVNCVLSPLLEIVPISNAPDLSTFTGVIFSSANAVDLAPQGDDRPAYCVGNVTAQHANASGWPVMACAQTAEQLIPMIDDMAPKGPLLHLAGKHRRGDIAARLTASGIKTDVHVLYDQIPIALSDAAHRVLNGKGRVVVPLFSPRSAAYFIEQVQDLRNVVIVAISDAVAKKCRGAGAADVLVSPAPTGQELRQYVEKLLRSTSLA